MKRIFYFSALSIFSNTQTRKLFKLYLNISMGKTICLHIAQSPNLMIKNVC